MRSDVQSSFLSRGARSTVFVLAAAALLAGCSSAASPDNGRPVDAEKWFRRAQTDFTQADFEEAHDSIAKASQLVPEDQEVKTLAARIALASLNYAEVLRLLKGVRTSEAAGLRGRALWYKGDLEAAADELDVMLNDPEVKDDWAKSITKLARQGAGRTPFVLSGSMLALAKMQHVSQVAPYFVIEVQIQGENALALIATGSAEVVLDSTTRPEPSWVSIVLGQDPDAARRLEIHDVPALAQDLSGISKEVGAPIKALLGVNLLRHLNSTMDYAGEQFVARSFAPPPPPRATRLNVHYVRGGGMVVRGTMGGEKGPGAAFLVDTSRPFPLALDTEGWKKAGSTVESLKLVEGDPEQKLRQGIVPLLRLGAFDLPRIPSLHGVPVADLEKVMGVDLDGVMGTSMLARFRCTFGDDGRVLWIEDDSEVMQMMQMQLPPEAPANSREAAPPPAMPPAPAALPPANNAPNKKK